MKSSNYCEVDSMKKYNLVIWKYSLFPQGVSILVKRGDLTKQTEEWNYTNTRKEFV